MVTRLFAMVIAAGSLVVGGLLAMIGFAAFTSADTVMQEIVAGTLIASSAGLLTAAGIWARVEQAERTSRGAKQIDPEYLRSSAATLEDIRDRGYDTVDRLEKMARVTRQ